MDEAFWMIAFAFSSVEGILYRNEQILNLLSQLQRDWVRMERCSFRVAARPVLLKPIDREDM